ncbi:hypothetical protein [uncultured Cyclobacterium sp.]|uniref:hypothetical protein n=1 Tax=uncultured Cyclobacterium sp. TaxID=453820 RepID=UPI0030EDC471|tara:strand:- start:128046 stop:128360 length:315 start_codon:yes stop_codon:yes gene_type:complete
MSKRIDKATEHYLIPLLLAFGSIFLIVSVFYWNEWRNVANQNFLYPYYPINGTDGVKAFLFSTSISGFVYFSITICCFVAVLIKRRIFCLLSTFLSVIGFFFLF